MKKNRITLFIIILLLLFSRAALCFGEEHDIKKEVKTEDKINAAASDTAEVKSYDGKTIPEYLKKAYARSTGNVSYTLESKELGRIKVYYKNPGVYRIDSDNKGKRTITVVNEEKAWIYDESKEMTVDSAVPENELEKFKKYGFNESVSGENMIYSYLNKDLKIKCELTIDTKENLIIQERVYNETGKLLAEADFNDYNFGIQNEELFKKPSGSKKSENNAKDNDSGKEEKIKTDDKKDEGTEKK
ncbi:MAG: hypothetical protein QMC67_04120 [Candidatus Wallbacteria bacterium]